MKTSRVSCRVRKGVVSTTVSQTSRKGVGMSVQPPRLPDSPGWPIALAQVVLDAIADRPQPDTRDWVSAARKAAGHGYKVELDISNNTEIAALNVSIALPVDVVSGGA